MQWKSSLHNNSGRKGGRNVFRALKTCEIRGSSVEPRGIRCVVKAILESSRISVLRLKSVRDGWGCKSRPPGLVQLQTAPARHQGPYRNAPSRRTEAGPYRNERVAGIETDSDEEQENCGNPGEFAFFAGPLSTAFFVFVKRELRVQIPPSASLLSADASCGHVMSDSQNRHFGLSG